MDSLKKVMNEELCYYNKQINIWYKSNEKVLSILTIPFHTEFLFNKIIVEIINQKKRILYVWGESGENKRITSDKH